MKEHAAMLRADQDRIEDWLAQRFFALPPRADLYDAMNYSLLSGGKRIRPVLTLAACRFCGGEVEQALPLACAVEMVHTYSLIHDDLPSMDDDDLRRGKPTNHKVFGEATAILAGDGLLAAAFESIASAALPPERAVEAVKVLARAAGPGGMVGGQALDMAGEGRALTLSEVKELQQLKTGALISAAVDLGCIAANGSEERRHALHNYAAALGLAFQIRDDILDVESSAEVLGKSVGSDAAHEKNTYVVLRGVSACCEMVSELTEKAVGAVAPLDKREFLCWLARTMAQRDR